VFARELQADRLDVKHRLWTPAGAWWVVSLASAQAPAVPGSSAPEGPALLLRELQSRSVPADFSAAERCWSFLELTFIII